MMYVISIRVKENKNLIRDGNATEPWNPFMSEFTARIYCMQSQQPPLPPSPTPKGQSNKKRGVSRSNSIFRSGNAVLKQALT